MEPAQPSAVYTSLKGKVVLVTGGASGIGEAIVEAFVQQGSRVLFLDIQDDAATSLTQRLARPDCIAPEYFHCDLANIVELQSVVEKILSRFPAIDVLINNAGNDKRHKIEEVTPEFWDWCMQINLKQQFFMAQAVLPGMRKAKRGSIINMSSIGWVIPSVGIPVYVTAKAAVVGMTRTLAHEVGSDGVRVNCVMPGAIITEKQRKLWYTEEYKQQIQTRQAIKREIQPDEVAKLILFLASDESLTITNQSFVIDAGWV
ncbi:MAG TPA: SDR family oxidoreductase [Candidatus Eisenbacteria bacterium]|nr:SDR family oxidoreductase [Candidatus Eisenbacteria bacterium]